MLPIEFWLALVAFFGTTFPTIMYFRISGTKLEVRANKIIKEKKPIITKKYLEVSEKIIERFKESRTFTEKLEQILEDISFARVWLNNTFVIDLSEVVNRMTHSFRYGFSLVISLIVIAFLPDVGFDATITFYLQMAFIGLIALFGYRYISDGLLSISSLRRFEVLFNEIERIEKFDKLYDVLEDEIFR